VFYDVTAGDIDVPCVPYVLDSVTIGSSNPLMPPVQAMTSPRAFGVDWHWRSTHEPPLRKFSTVLVSMAVLTSLLANCVLSPQIYAEDVRK
jgi:hypothetical protein